MEIRKITKKLIWEEFLSQCEERTFLQSWNWGEFQEKMGNKIWRLGIYADDGDWVSVALVVKIVARRGTFLLIPHGPNIKLKVKSQKLKVLEILLDKLKKIGKEEKASFVRMVPLWERSAENQKFLHGLGFRKAPMHANAYEATLKLNLSPSEQELLMNMRKTTRYLVRRALKNSELKIIKSDKIEDIELYNKLNQEVAGHQRFIPFSFEFVKNEFDVFVNNNQALLFFGKYQDKIVASAIIIFWSEIAFYHYAALLPKYHKTPIAYLLQWEAIKEAKRRNCLWYDFWGYINPKENFKHPWAGPSLFKMGFGGNVYQYVGTQDFPFSKKYWLTYIFEKLRKIKRRL